MFKSCCLLVLAYAFALLCGAFSWLFVSTTQSFGILARNSLVGMCAASLPISVLVAVIYTATCTSSDRSVDVFLVMLAATSSMASGIGAAIFQTSSAGSSIMGCLAGGMVFGGCGIIVFSIVEGCLEGSQGVDADDDDDTDTDTESCRGTEYRVVEQPCGNHLQLAVKS